MFLNVSRNRHNHSGDPRFTPNITMVEDRNKSSLGRDTGEISGKGFCRSHNSGDSWKQIC